MSLLPFLLDDYYTRPSRLQNQNFGLVLDPEDFVSPLTISRELRPSFGGFWGGYPRPWLSASSRSDIGSTVANDKEKFQANLDVQQFKPEEISVKITGENTVTIEGKHEEQRDQHGFVSRHFVRKYVLPKDCNLNQIESKLSSDGVLTITAPKVDQMEIEHKSVPITQTGQPMKSVEKKDQLSEN